MRWRDVVGYEGFYEISDVGTVRPLPRWVPRGKSGMFIKGGMMRTTPGSDGYPRVALMRSGERYLALVHVLILEAFVGPRPAGHDACHNNGDHSDCRLENLRWDTKSANMLDRVKHGTHHFSRRTHCSAGHEYTPESTKTRVRNGHVSRVCTRCVSEKLRRQAEARKARREGRPHDVRDLGYTPKAIRDLVSTIEKGHQ